MNEIEAQRKKQTEKNDRELAPLLSGISDALGYDLHSFTEFDQVPTERVVKNISLIAQVIAEEEESSARKYTVMQLLGAHPNMGFDTCVKFFELLPADPEDMSMWRGWVAHEINSSITADNADEFLKLMQECRPKWDRRLLYYGLPKIKDKKYNPQIEELIREGLQDVSTLWPAADAAKKKKLTSLLPDLYESLNLTDDREIKRAVQKAIDSLEKAQFKQK